MAIERVRSHFEARGSAREPRWAELVAIAAAIAWYFYLGYGITLDPRNIEWMLWGDWVQPLWSFSFYRNADWMLPLGALPNWIYPFGSSVGFADSNPGLAAVFKLLAPWLPQKFQFCGLWFLLCYVAQAYFGTRIVALVSKSQLERALGGILFALTPVLPMRSHHVVLSGVFLVTGMLYFALRPCASRSLCPRALGVGLLMAFWASSTNGYFSVMVLALYWALCLRLVVCDRLLMPREGVLAAALGLAVTLATYWLVGYLGYQRTLLQAEGFGQFSSDLASLFNPLQWSRFFEGMPAQPRQWEGAAYLGLGVLLLVLLRVGLWLRAPRVMIAQLKPIWPVALVVMLMWVYAWSSHVTWLGEEVLSLDALYAKVPEVTNIFRSSGRFIWALHMALIAAGVSAALALSSRPLRAALLIVAVLLQATELKADRVHFSDATLAINRDPAWAASAKDYRHLALLPVRIQWICPDYDEAMVSRFAFEAYIRKWTFNSGLLGRNPEKIPGQCSRGLDAGGVDEQTIYVVQPVLLAEFRAAQATCGAIDGFLVCVSARRRTALRDALQRSAAY